MVNITDYILSNLPNLLSYLISIVFLLTVLLLYRYSGHKGFMAIFIGHVFSFLWESFYLFGLQGNLWQEVLIEQGYSNVEITMTFLVAALITFILNLARVSLFIFGLYVLARDKRRLIRPRESIPRTESWMNQQ